MTEDETAARTSGNEDEVALDQIFVAPEYSRAASRFFAQAVTAVARTRSPILEHLDTEREEFVPSTTMTVADGSVLRTEPTAIVAEAALDWASLMEGNFDGFHMTVDAMAQSYADGLTGALYDHLSSVTDFTGQTVDRRGRDHWETLLEGLEVVEWLPDDHGVVRVPTLHINPTNAAKFANPPDWFADALSDLAQRKQKEWDVRRRHRRLPR